MTCTDGAMDQVVADFIGNRFHTLFFEEKKQRKKWSLVWKNLFGWLFSFASSWPTTLEMAILHVAPSNIYETLRRKLWRSVVCCNCVFFSLLNRTHNTFSLFYLFLMKTNVDAIDCLYQPTNHPPVTHRSTLLLLPCSAWLYSLEHLKKGVIL